MNTRCEKLLKLGHESSMEAILVTSPINMRYFSGFTGTDGCLLISNKKQILYTDFRYTIQANMETHNEFEVREIHSGTQYSQAVGTELTEQMCATCGFEDEVMTIRQYSSFSKIKCQLVGASEIMSKIRIVKTQNEIDSIIHAQNIADKAFMELIGILAPGMTERQVANELEYFMKKFGAEEKSFDTIVGSGPNGALCHATPSDRKLSRGDMVVIDFGCKYNGYCSDMTRTIAIGEPCDELKKIYRVVREAQALTLRAVKPGVEGKKLDWIARECIKARGYGEFFGHSLGHGFGLEVHEAPRASEKSHDILHAGMTVTVEPGIYIEGLGGVRIEDCVIVTEDSYINPVTTTKDLIIIE